MPAPTAVRASAPLRTATVVSLAAALAGLAVEFVVPGGWGAAGPVVLVCGLLLGLPHGAADHVLLGARPAGPPRGWGLVVGGYAALAVVTWLLFRAFPGPGLALFVALSVWHFGSGETAVADLRRGGPVRRRVAAALVLGSVVLLVPLARPSPEAERVLAAVLPGSAAAPALLPSAVVPGVVVAAVVLGAVLLVARRRLEALEVAVLLAVVLVLPPPVALGLWFGTWHSLRHVARLAVQDPAADPRAALRRFLRAAALPTAAALVVLLVLWRTTGGGHGLVAVLLPVLAALTVPHTLTVTWLDRARGQAGSRRIGTCGMPSST
ncbi:beta-carotene 15,15'-dioxygenase, Brp/Blh family [Geodermatophilus sp. SYSU D00079]